MIRGNTIVGSGDEATHVEWFLPEQPTVGVVPLVFVHGGSHDGRCFTETPDGRTGWAPYAASHGRPAYVIDWAGHGRSPAASDLSRLSMSTIACGAARVVDEHVGRAVLVTHSMGGVIGWRVAATIPARVAAIVAVAPGPPAELLPRMDARGSEVVAEDAGPHVASVALVRKMWANSARFPHDAFDAYLRSLIPCSARAVNERNNVDGNGITVGDRGALAGIPVLIVTGDQDPRHPREADEAIAQYFGAEFIWLPDRGISGHGHMQMIEHGNDAIADLFLGWLTDRGL